MEVIRRKFMSVIQSHLEILNDRIIGWYGLLLPILQEVESSNKDNHENKIQVDVKEKYGSLRIDFSSGNTYLEQLASRAETESKKVCQLCGARGKTVWIKDWCWTLCGYHAKARKKSDHDSEKTRLLFIKYLKKDKRL
jgi:hypothetical protein